MKKNSIINTDFHQWTGLNNTFQLHLYFVIGMFLFSSIFLYVFVPFNIEHWFAQVSPFESYKNVVLLIIGGLTLFFSHGLEFFIFKTKQMRLWHYWLFYIIDASFLAIVYSLFYIRPTQLFIDNLKETFPLTSLIIGLWYSFCFALLWVNKTKQIREEEKTPTSSTLSLISLYDEKERLVLKILQEDLFYIESADNYVIVHYNKKGTEKKEWIRTSLKQLESDLSSFNCIRCHRSFLVNKTNILSIKKENRSYFITMKEPIKKIIPISRSFETKIIIPS